MKSTARMDLAYELRCQGLTFKEIGKRLGVSAGRANQLYRSKLWRINQPPCWSDGLSIRAHNALNNRDIHSRQEALDAFLNKLRPGRGRNYGWKTHAEVAKWLGFPEPKRPPQKPQVFYSCPHCGKPVSKSKLVRHDPKPT